MSQYAKAIAAFFAALGTWGATALLDGTLDPAEWFGLCGVVVATAAVFQVPNDEGDEGGQAAIWYVLLGAAAAVILLALANRIDL